MCLHTEMCPAKRKSSPVTSMDEEAKTWPASRRSSLKRKPRKVLYPPPVKRYLPRQEKDTTKKWLLILGAIMLLQIYCEDATECDLDFPTNTIVAIPMETGPTSNRLMETSIQQPSNVSILFFMTVDPEN